METCCVVPLVIVAQIVYLFDIRGYYVFRILILDKWYDFRT